MTRRDALRSLALFLGQSPLWTAQQPESSGDSLVSGLKNEAPSRLRLHE